MPRDDGQVGKNRHDPSLLRLSIAVFIAVMLACIGLRVFLASGAWWFEVVLIAAIVLAAAAAARSLGSAHPRRRYLSSVIATAVLVVYLIVRFAADTTVLLVPGGDTVARFRQLIEAAAASIYVQSMPAVVTPGILLLVVAGVGVLAIVTDFLAIGLRAPALAGLPLCVPLVIPAMIVPDASDGFVFVAAAAGYLYLLLVSRHGRALSLGLGAGALAIVVALVVPVALPPVAAVEGIGRLSTGVNPTIDLGKDLAAQVDTPVLSYTTRSGDSHYMRLVTLDTFTGAAWTPDEPRPDPGNDVSGFVRPAGLSAQVRTTVERSQVRVNRLRSPWLPVPYPPTRISGLSGDWYWEDGTLAVSSPDADVAGQTYTVTSLTLHPTPEQLSAAGDRVPAAMSQYLSLPDDLPAVISDTARTVTENETSNYADAVALQEYFRSNLFEYSVQAPIDDGYDGTGMDVITKFLDVKKGYCVHFASAMAVMARSLGIPSRIAVGFQGGTKSEGGGSGLPESYRVSSNDLHAWPELYFDSIGWVPFEPTPGRGSVPSYADQGVAGVPAPLSPAELAARSTETPDPAAVQEDEQETTGDEAVADASVSQTLIVWLQWLAIAAAVVLLVLSPAFARALARGRRLRAGTAEAAWQEVTMTAEDVGIALPETLTPREVARALDGAGGAHLERLRVGIERASYSAASPLPPEPRDVREVTDRLLAEATPRRRWLARLLPPSSWKRIARAFLRPGR